MKLYSKKQLVTYSISTGILAAVAVSVVFTFFKNDSPKKSGKEISAVEKNQSELKKKFRRHLKRFLSRRKTAHTRRTNLKTFRCTKNATRQL